MNACGKVFLITGSTDGIGAHTAERLTQVGANVLVHGRDEARVSNMVSHLRIENNSHLVCGYTADFSSLEAVRQLAASIRQQHPRLDVLINNAGTYQQERVLSRDGFEMSWAVNVLAPFLLTALLYDCITERVVNVSSVYAAHSIDWDNLQQEREFSGQGAYSLSALCSMLFTYELARRLKAAGSAVTANCLDPGTVSTKLLRAGWGPGGISVQDANDELVIATDPRLDQLSGQYFVAKACWRGPDVSYDTAAQQRLWALLEQQCGVAFPI